MEQTKFFISVFEASSAKIVRREIKIYKDCDARQRSMKNIAENCDMSAKESLQSVSRSLLGHSVPWPSTGRWF